MDNFTTSVYLHFHREHCVLISTSNNVNRDFRWDNNGYAKHVWLLTAKSGARIQPDINLDTDRRVHLEERHYRASNCWTDRLDRMMTAFCDTKGKIRFISFISFRVNMYVHAIHISRHIRQFDLLPQRWSLLDREFSSSFFFSSFFFYSVSSFHRKCNSRWTVILVFSLYANRRIGVAIFSLRCVSSPP